MEKTKLNLRSVKLEMPLHYNRETTNKRFKHFSTVDCAINVNCDDGDILGSEIF